MSPLGETSGTLSADTTLFFSPLSRESAMTLSTLLVKIMAYFEDTDLTSMKNDTLIDFLDNLLKSFMDAQK